MTEGMLTFDMWRMNITPEMLDGLPDDPRPVAEQGGTLALNDLLGIAPDDLTIVAGVRSCTLRVAASLSLEDWMIRYFHDSGNQMMFHGNRLVLPGMPIDLCPDVNKLVPGLHAIYWRDPGTKRMCRAYLGIQHGAAGGVC